MSNKNVCKKSLTSTVNNLIRAPSTEFHGTKNDPTHIIKSFFASLVNFCRPIKNSPLNLTKNLYLKLCIYNLDSRISCDRNVMKRVGVFNFTSNTFRLFMKFTIKIPKLVLPIPS